MKKIVSLTFVTETFSIVLLINILDSLIHKNILLPLLLLFHIIKRLEIFIKLQEIEKYF